MAALDSLPDDLIDNAAVLGTLSLITAALFILDLAGPRAKTPKRNATETKKVTETKSQKTEIYDIEKEIEPVERIQLESEKTSKTNDTKEVTTTLKNGLNHNSGPNGQNNINQGQQIGYKRMKNKPNKFDIYGNDLSLDIDTDQDTTRVPEEHSPVWSRIKQGYILRLVAMMHKNSTF